MSQIIVKRNLMKIILENVYVSLAIMMMAQIIYANSVIIVGRRINFLII